MPLSIPCILWGLSPGQLFTSGTLLQGTIEFQTGSGTHVVNFPAAGPFGASQFLYMSGDGQADDLVTLLQASLNSGPDGAVFVVTLNQSGVCQIVGPSNWQLHGAAVATTVNLAIWGIAQSNVVTGGSGILTGGLRAYGAWYPGQPESIPDTLDSAPIVGAVTRSIAGIPFTVAIATLRLERDLHWSALDGGLVRNILAPVGTLGLTFESAWSNSISLGYPMRFYQDTTNRTATSYSIYEIRDYSPDGYPWKRRDDDVLFWDVELLLSLVQAAS